MRESVYVRYAPATLWPSMRAYEQRATRHLHQVFSSQRRNCCLEV